MPTIIKEVQISGNGLMKNKTCKVELFPSQEGVIRFFVKDSSTPIILDVDNVDNTNHCVVLGSKKNTLMLTEHFTAACAFAGITSMDVHTTESEMPILDGSAKCWIELFARAGVEKSVKKPIEIKKPIYYLNEKTHMIIIPDNKFRISYGVNYNHPELHNRWVSFEGKNFKEIIEARTFGYLKDLKKYQFFGYARGVTYENTVGLLENSYTTALRSEFEPAKHKILDLIGDLYLSGINPLDLKAQIIVKEAGHAVHVKVAKMLKESLGE